MSHATQLICRLFLILSLVGTSGCALFDERSGPEKFYGPREQVYVASFEEVWRAVNIVLQPYPLRISNMDQGLLETDTLKESRVWEPIQKRNSAGSGESYKLNIHVVKGAYSSQSATKVTVVKDAQVQRDFFSDPKAIPSDGLEEKSILYRIGREIQIERALGRAQKKLNNSQ